MINVYDNFPAPHPFKITVLLYEYCVHCNNVCIYNIIRQRTQSSLKIWCLYVYQYVCVHATYVCINNWIIYAKLCSPVNLCQLIKSTKFLMTCRSCMTFVYINLHDGSGSIKLVQLLQLFDSQTFNKYVLRMIKVFSI